MRTLLTLNICLMCHVQILLLSENNIGDAGLTALAKAVESGALASLEKLALGSDKIGDKGMKALADACASGALASLTNINLHGNPGNSEPVEQAMKARKK